MTAVYTLGIMTGNSLDATDIVLTAFENADGKISQQRNTLFSSVRNRNGIIAERRAPVRHAVDMPRVPCR